MNLKALAMTVLVAGLLQQTTSTLVLAEESTVKVGCLYPLTGPAGRYGRDSVVAIQMAEEYLRSLEPADYPVLEIVVEDTRSKSLRSEQIARRFVEEEQVHFLCGVVSSSVARAVSAEAARQKTFFIGTDHASPSLTNEALHPYYFRVNNGTRQSMLAGARYIQEHYSADDTPLTIAFIGPDYEYGYQAWDDLRAFLDQEGVSYHVVGEYWPRLFETDYTLYLQQLMNEPADIVVSGQWGLDLVTLVKQAQLSGLFDETQFMNFDAGGNFEVLAELGNDMPLGLVLSARHHVNWPETDANTAFVEEFYRLAGRYPSYAAQGAYTGILAIAEAVKEAGGVSDPDALRTALENLKLSLPEDPEGFVSVMDPVSHQLLQVQAIGKTVFNNAYEPATVLLGQWSVYYPPETWPIFSTTPDE
jgi:branched-chain amino acid transport system substrate-binding protein